MVAIPFAHAGHWLISLVYAAPAFLISAALLWQGAKERRARRRRARHDAENLPAD